MFGLAGSRVVPYIRAWRAHDPSMKILVADDDPVSLTLLVDILTSAQADYDLITAEDGQQAWAGLEAHPDLKLAIIDLAMPGMTGLDWLARTRKDPRFTTLPVIVCTGNTDRPTVSTVAALGVSNYLVKPFTRTSVLEKVWHVCRPAPTDAPVLRDLAGARQRMEIDRDTHRELLANLVRIADLWAGDARRALEFPHIRALTIRATNLRQMLASLGAAALAARLQEFEEVLGPFRVKPLAADLHACLRKTQQAGEKIQLEIDRLREALDSIT